MPSTFCSPQQTYASLTLPLLVNFTLDSALENKKPLLSQVDPTIHLFSEFHPASSSVILSHQPIPNFFISSTPHSLRTISFPPAYKIFIYHLSGINFLNFAPYLTMTSFSLRVWAGPWAVQLQSLWTHSSVFIDTTIHAVQPTAVWLLPSLLPWNWSHKITKAVLVASFNWYLLALI